MGFNTDILSATTISGGTFYGDGSGLVGNTITEIINSPTQNPINVNTSNDYLPITGNDQYQDEASNYISWTNGSNNGTGFNPWTITAQPNTGVFLGNPASDGMGTAGIGTNAFALFATDGSNYVSTSRTFTSGMNVGDVFSFYWVINFDANGGNKGFDLKAGGTPIFNANNNNTSTITSNLSSPNNIIDSSYGTTPMLVTLTRTSDILYNITITSRSGGPTYSASINSPLVVNEINFYCGAQGDGLGQRNLFFNQLLITKTTELLKITVDDLGSLFGGGSLYEVGSGTDSTQRCGVNNVANGNCSIVAGGFCNTSSNDRSTVSGGQNNTSSGFGSTVSGGQFNAAIGDRSTIGGGRLNTSSGGYSFVGGGRLNTSSGGFSTVSGGFCNTTSGTYSTIGGGRQNTACGTDSTISGGYCNTSSCYGSTVSGGRNNVTINNYSTVSGGIQNTSSGQYSTIGGGISNVSGINGTVSGVYNQTYLGSTLNGTFNSISPSSTSSGYGNGATFDFTFNTGSLSSVNVIAIGSGYVNGDLLTFDGTLFGGSSGTDDVTLNINTQNIGNFSTISGGRQNTSSGDNSTVSGGYNNTSSGYSSTVSGGRENTSSCNDSTVSGGRLNISSNSFSTVSGGVFNTSSGNYSTVGGGRCNTSSGDSSTLSGGYRNTSSGRYSTVSGGYRNTSINGCSAILGGQCNTSQHDCSFIVGSGIFSTAANTTHVNCLHFSNIPTSSAGLAPGTVWSDSGMLCIA